MHAMASLRPERLALQLKLDQVRRIAHATDFLLAAPDYDRRRADACEFYVAEIGCFNLCIKLIDIARFRLALHRAKHLVHQPAEVIKPVSLRYFCQWKYLVHGV